jgi:methylmalonyl-CoA mutase C-terminal domain/subunit
MVENIPEKIKVLVAKPGSDGHRIGPELLCKIFRDAGMEVIYTGIYQTPEMIVNAAIQEDVDVIALSCMSVSATANFTDTMEALKEKDVADRFCVIGGGIIPEEDKPYLEGIGITGNYGPGTPLKTIVDHVVERVRTKRKRE